MVAPHLSGGTQMRLLSQDRDAFASTCLWRIPPGWRCRKTYVNGADEQLFVLEGALFIGEQRLVKGGYACHSIGCEHGEMRSDQGALVLAMWDGPIEKAPMSPYSAGNEPIFIDTKSTDGAPTPVEGPVPGITVKILRKVPETDGMTMLINIPAGWHEPRSEHHDCVEESFKVSGDIWIVENGTPQVLSAGDYFYRPPRIKHGPMKTENGTSSLIRFSAEVTNHYGPLGEQVEPVQGPINEPNS